MYYYWATSSLKAARRFRLTAAANADNPLNLAWANNFRAKGPPFYSHTMADRLMHLGEETWKTGQGGWSPPPSSLFTASNEQPIHQRTVNGRQVSVFQDTLSLISAPNVLQWRRNRFSTGAFLK